MKMNVKFETTEQVFNVGFSKRGKTFSTSVKDVIDLTEGQKEIAYQGGYTEGHETGYETGRAAGYEQGYDTGAAEGLVKGYESGHADGLVKGREDGYSEGQKAGYQTGHKDGLAEGYDAGHAVGRTEGYEDGYEQGHGEATAEGQEVIDSLITNGTGTAKTFESNVTSLRQYALRGTDFVTVRLPNVTTMGTYAFHNCTSLVNIHLPKLAVLGGYDFQNCRKVQKFDLPSVTSVDVASFYGCSGMTALVLRANQVCELKNTSAFTNSSIAAGTAYIYVPAALVDQYKAATNWSTYTAQIRAIEDYLEIAGNGA